MAEPPVNIRAKFSSFTAGDNLTPTRVVIHATCPNVGYPRASGPGTALGTARYFASGSAGGSAHYICDPGDEQHCVPDGTIAFHAPPNPRSIGIEINSEGGDYPKSYTRAEWLSPQVWPAVVRAAARTRELCDRFHIPMVRINSSDLLAGKHGICGHVDVSQAWHQSTHSDPGPQFPWVEFMAAVTGAPTPILTTTGENMLDNYLVKGSGSLRINYPVGVASGVTAAGYISISGDGPTQGTAHVYFQSDTSGISDFAWTIGFKDGLSQRRWMALPDGTTMININYAFPEGGCITLEGRSR